MISKIQVNRLGILTALLTFSFLALGFRLVDLQVVRHHEFKSEVNNRVEHSFFIEPRRGEIRDVRGNTLVYSEFVKTVVANPEYIKTHWYEMASLIAEDLGYEVDVLAEKLKPRTNSNGSKLRYVMLKNKVTENQWELIAAKLKACRFSYGEKKVLKKNYMDLKNLQTKAIYCDPRKDTQLRIHPHNNFASQLLGYGGVDQSPPKNDRKETFKGKSGIEQRMNKVLAGVPGWGRKFYAKTSLELTHSREVYKNVQNGRHVVLTIDMGVQQILEDALKEAMKEHQPLTASAIVIRPRTGDVLAMASLPDFNPNSLGDSPVGTWNNRIISDVYEPGSTFKVIVIAAALDEKVIRITDSVFCENGCYMYAGRALHDHHSYGNLTVEQIITKSSNIGAAKIAMKLGPQALYRYLSDFGFGKKTGIMVSGETYGILRSPDKWKKISISRIAMGHEIAASSLQMVMAMSAIANKGQLIQPRLIDRLVDDAGQTIIKFPNTKPRQVVSPATAKLMVQALKTVVKPGGTATAASLPHYTVAGKTGTAQKAATDGKRKGYLPGKFFSSFLGFLPADAPELCICVILDSPSRKGYYGGTVAGPIFKVIAEKTARHLGVRPDLISTTDLAFLN